MKQLLLPIDGTKRSFRTVSWVMNNYKPDEVEITVMMVVDSINELDIKQSHTSAQEYMQMKLKEVSDALTEAGYTLKLEAGYGDPGETICAYAKKNNIDAMIMTKSTKKGWLSTIGSVTTYAVKYASVPVIIIPETK